MRGSKEKSKVIAPKIADMGNARNMLKTKNAKNLRDNVVNFNRSNIIASPT